MPKRPSVAMSSLGGRRGSSSSAAARSGNGGGGGASAPASGGGTRTENPMALLKEEDSTSDLWLTSAATSGASRAARSHHAPDVPKIRYENHTFRHMPKLPRAPAVKISSVKAMLSDLAANVFAPVAFIQQVRFGRPDEKSLLLKLGWRAIMWAALIAMIVVYDTTAKQMEDSHIVSSEVYHPVLLFLLYQCIRAHRLALALRNLVTNTVSTVAGAAESAVHRSLGLRLRDRSAVKLRDRSAASFSEPDGDGLTVEAKHLAARLTEPMNPRSAVVAAARAAVAAKTPAASPMSPKSAAMKRSKTHKNVAVAAETAKEVVGELISLRLIIPDQKLDSQLNGGHMYLHHLSEVVEQSRAATSRQQRAWRLNKTVTTPRERTVANSLSPLVYVNRIWEYCQPYGLFQKIRRWAFIIGGVQAFVPALFRLYSFRTACVDEVGAFWVNYCAQYYNATVNAAFPSNDNYTSAECNVFIHHPKGLDRWDDWKNCPVPKDPDFPQYDPALAKHIHPVTLFFGSDVLSSMLVALMSWYWASYILSTLSTVGVTYEVRLRVMRSLSNLFSGLNIGNDYKAPSEQVLKNSLAAQNMHQAWEKVASLPPLNMRLRRELRAAFVIADELKKTSECYIQTSGWLPLTYFLLPVIGFAGTVLITIFVDQGQTTLTAFFVLVLLDTAVVLLTVVVSLVLALRSNIKQGQHAKLLNEFKADMTVAMQEYAYIADDEGGDGSGGGGGGSGRASGSGSSGGSNGSAGAGAAAQRRAANGDLGSDIKESASTFQEMSLARMALQDVIDMMVRGDPLASFYGVQVTVPLLAKVFAAIGSVVIAQLVTLFSQKSKFPTPTRVEDFVVDVRGPVPPPFPEVFDPPF